VDENEIRQRMAAYKNFYHVIRLTETIETPGVRGHVPSQEKVHRAIRLQAPRPRDGYAGSALGVFRNVVTPRAHRIVRQP